MQRIGTSPSLNLGISKAAPHPSLFLLVLAEKDPAAFHAGRISVQLWLQ